ncbi:MAG TPA: TlpA disulfide reductase family protein [Flavihumibacter sp.]|jgi:thiol-disulfide isomerase/thioredoxin
MKQVVRVLLSSSLLFTACDNSMQTRNTNSFEAEHQRNKLLGTEIPRAALKSIDGQQLDLSSFKGKRLMVNLWASWCKPCLDEIPSIEKLYSKMNHDKSAIVLLSIDKDQDKARAYARENNLQTPVYFPDGRLPSIFEVPSIPTTFIYDENGLLVDRIVGDRDYDTKGYHDFFK